MKRFVLLGCVCGLAAGAFAVRPTTVYFVQHAHSDIGYARPQTEMIADYVHQIDLALDLCEATADYPEDAKFRWTCEALSVVADYLRMRPPAEIERLKKWVLKGQIEVTAMSMNTSEFAEPATLRAGLQPLATCRALGIPVRVAMQDDVNGFPWILADELADLGIQYTWTGENSGRAFIPFPKPTLYHWESPSGRALLAFRGDHYMTGNTFGIHTGDMAGFERHLQNYLTSLDQRGYPFDVIGVAYAGYAIDDSAPSTTANDLIRRWNAERAQATGIRLVSATPGMFFDAVTKQMTSANTPTYRVAFPDWWSDGFGTGALETSEARHALTTLGGAQALAAMSVLDGGQVPADLQRLFDSTLRNLDYWGEHTWGSNMAIQDPACWKEMEGRRAKYAFAWNALREARLAREGALGLVRAQFAREADYDAITLFNPLPWARSGTVDAFIERDIIPGGAGFRFVDVAGRAIPAIYLQENTAGRASGADGGYYRLFVDNMPPCGYRTYRIEIGGLPNVKPAPAELENASYKVTLDVARGAVTHLVDKRTGRDLVDAGAPYELGEVLYEEMHKERHCINQLGAYRPGAFTRRRCANFKRVGGVSNDLYDAIRLAGDFPEEGASRFTVEIRLLKTSPDVEFHYTLRRAHSEKTSSVYVAFPFAGTKLRCDVPGGILKPGENQLEGSSTAWNVAQHFLAATDGTNETWMTCRDAPLVQFGKLFADDPFQYVKKYAKAYVFGWPMNNYWWTNFAATQNGDFAWSYRLTAHTQAGDDAAAMRWALADRRLFVANVTAKGPARNRPREQRGLVVSDPGLIATDVAPARDGNGIVLAVASFVDAPQQLVVKDGASRVRAFVRIDATERALGEPVKVLTVKPRENLLVRVLPAQPEGSVPSVQAGSVPSAPKGSVPSVQAGSVPSAPKGSVPLAAYRFYRFCVTETKGTCVGTQVAELRFFSGNRDITDEKTRVFADTNTVTAAGKRWHERQPPEQAFDHVLLEKWFDWRGASSEPPAVRAAVWVGVEFPQPVKITKYEWYTCEDYPLRDPSAWKFQGSHDGRTWHDLDVVTGYNAPHARNVLGCARNLIR